MTTNHYPDDLTIEVITALQQEDDAELRKEDYPLPPTRSARTRKPSSGPSTTTTARSLADDANGPARRRASDDGPQKHRQRRARQKAARHPRSGVSSGVRGGLMAPPKKRNKRNPPRPDGRRLVVRGIRRDPPDLHKLAKVIASLAKTLADENHEHDSSAPREPQKSPEENPPSAHPEAA